MSNAERILHRLDELLNAPAELTLFGRAAFQLGFADLPPEYGRSLDVDGVLWAGQSEQLLRETNFWTALEQLNEEFSSEGLFISHLFEEQQLILTPEWRAQRIVLPGAWQRLQVLRLGNGDLFLTKLMRFDPLDLEDARFLVHASDWDEHAIRDWFARARFPASPELREQFDLCVREILKDA